MLYVVTPSTIINNTMSDYHIPTYVTCTTCSTLLHPTDIAVTHTEENQSPYMFCTPQCYTQWATEEYEVDLEEYA